jgi:hypothetical protein
MHHHDVVAPGDLEVAVVGRLHLRHEHLEPSGVGRHPLAREQLAPMVAVHGREQVGCALDQAHQRVRRHRDPLGREVAPQAVKRDDYRELHVTSQADVTFERS